MTALARSDRFRSRDMNAAWRHVDVVLCVAVVICEAYGSLMIYSATRHRPQPLDYISKHVLFVAAGVVVAAVVAAIDYRRLCDYWWAVYAVSVAGLVGVLIPGVGALIKGTRGWYRLGFFQVQPAEFAKVGVILAVAAFLGHIEGKVGIGDLASALVLLGVPMGLIMLQPDLGTTLVYVVIGVGMLVVAGTPARYLVALVVVGVVGIAAILTSDTLDQYQKDRLTAFASPDQASSRALYNTKQAQLAIASGGMTGKGLFEGPQTKGNFVPEQQTDFIFTVPGEELGFAGGALLIVLLGVVVWRVWRTALLAADPAGRYICVGVLCMLVFHIFENIGMNLGIMPVTGIPLPFVSYGGSSTLATFAAVGLVLNVHMRRYS